VTPQSVICILESPQDASQIEALRATRYGDRSLSWRARSACERHEVQSIPHTYTYISWCHVCLRLRHSARRYGPLGCAGACCPTMSRCRSTRLTLSPSEDATGLRSLSHHLRAELPTHSTSHTFVFITINLIVCHGFRILHDMTCYAHALLHAYM
jgi:hypothetical protein